jgi:GTP-binding protein
MRRRIWRGLGLAHEKNFTAPSVAGYAADVLRRPAEVRHLGSFPDEVPPGRLPEVAFAGRSNVGKSSAINALLGRRGVARTSKHPGRTQAINLFEVDGRLCFADLPGYGYARVSKAMRASWKELVEGYLADRDVLAFVVLLVDARLPAQEMDRVLVRGLQEVDVPVVGVATKADGVPRARRGSLQQLAADLGLDGLLPFSSRTGEGVEALWKEISTRCRAPGR